MFINVIDADDDKSRSDDTVLLLLSTQYEPAICNKPNNVEILSWGRGLPGPVWWPLPGNCGYFCWMLDFAQHTTNLDYQEEGDEPSRHFTPVSFFFSLGQRSHDPPHSAPDWLPLLVGFRLWEHDCDDL